jgi:hypothetical protein
VKLHLKLVAGTGSQHVARVRTAARDVGAAAVRPLFPDAASADLASLFVVDLPDDADPSRVMAALRDEDAVEAVEPEALRELT